MFSHWDVLELNMKIADPLQDPSVGWNDPDLVNIVEVEKVPEPVTSGRNG